LSHRAGTANDGRHGLHVIGTGAMNKRKLLKKVLAGPTNIRFGDMVALVEAFGFRVARVSGSHHIFERAGVSELVNLQNRKGKAKPYQVKQFLQVVEQHNLRLEDRS
jgi:hypothetical protein